MLYHGLVACHYLPKLLLGNFNDFVSASEKSGGVALNAQFTILLGDTIH